MINIAVLGYGTVGSGVVEVINTNHDIVNAKATEEINIKYVLDLREFPGSPIENILVHDFDTILNDESVKIVVEVMGGVEPAYTFVKKSLLAGKSVCTSNKELVAKHGPELLAIAREKNINFLFEASVGGGIPIIRPLNSSLTADDILEITGILNGTTNFILTKMTEEGWDFDEALKTAQELGYAERNPEADIEGYDACRKIAILSSLAFGKNVDFEKIYTEGISKVTSMDVAYAKKMNRVIKLLASSKKEDGGYYAMVAPFMVGESNPLHSVNGVFNAIFVKGNVLDDVMFYGSGAGKLPTASAVVSDVVDAAKHSGTTIHIQWEPEELGLSSMDDAVFAYFVRVKGKKSQMLKQVEGAFGAAVEVIELDGAPDEFAIVTDYTSEKMFKERAAKLDCILSTIRMK